MNTHGSIFREVLACDTPEAADHVIRRHARAAKREGAEDLIRNNLRYMRGYYRQADYDKMTRLLRLNVRTTTRRAS